MARPDNATLKKMLRQRFPSTSFSVTRGRGTGYGWSRISWTDGPSTILLEQYLGEIGSAPGSMDITDYFTGERIWTSRHLSEQFRQRIAASLLPGKVLPPEAVWTYGVLRSNAGGWYDFNDCIYRAASARYTSDLERAKFDAHAWLEAWAHNRREAPTSVIMYA